MINSICYQMHYLIPSIKNKVEIFQWDKECTR